MEIAELIALPLAERLRAMEALWDSLCRRPASDALVPAWHAEALSARAKALDAGTEKTSSWADAKKRIRVNAEQITGTR